MKLNFVTKIAKISKVVHVIVMTTCSYWWGIGWEMQMPQNVHALLNDKKKYFWKLMVEIFGGSFVFDDF